jgi:hypothetical protein
MYDPDEHLQGDRWSERTEETTPWRVAGAEAPNRSPTPSQPYQAERRAARRVDYRVEAELEGIEVGRGELRLADVSTTGAFVDSRTVLPVGTVASLRFTVSGRVIRVLAEIRYSVAPFGMGVRFLDLVPADRAAIEALIAHGV